MKRTMSDIGKLALPILICSSVAEAATITIRARGTEADGAFAHFRVLVNGTVIGQANAQSMARDLNVG
ncbi:MAG TPA: carbohydrate-binding domain-containing protein [Oligoflexus sp.]|uniref:carbohydrate-binding domain-containing protein n=1 Tax=Oligoflexus sp. TaxID=1971216 RepID=UPI002D482D9C|nr:carbohydrate-binding domain-containing protein [Oligoflexus sp.]HYX36572.1 carbohydrate-binding domain-containing protein [Oligoflexus sp.]